MLIITGPPGAGKSTVARLVAADSPVAACVEADWFWTTIVSGFIEPWLPEADGQNRTVIRSALAAAQTFDNGGYATVVDGILGPWMFDVVTDCLGHGERIDYVVLRPSVQICLQRARERPGIERVPGHPPLRDSGPIRQLWRSFADLGTLEGHVVDSSEMTERQVVAAIGDGIDAGRFTLDLRSMSERTPRLADQQSCPQCGAPGVRIVYGKPSTATRGAAERGEVILGGCRVENGRPTRSCSGGHTW